MAKRQKTLTSLALGVFCLAGLSESFAATPLKLAGVIDGIVNGVGSQSKGIGEWLRLLSSGSIRSYATWVALGSVALLLAMGLAAGVVR